VVFACSDGLTNALSDEEIATVLKLQGDAVSLTQKLMNAVLDKKKHMPQLRLDNVSIALLKA
jgi:serine/threonine protein phosphatase PrpC